MTVSRTVEGGGSGAPTSPRATAEAVRDFLGLALDLDRMAGIVDENLYRQRNG